MTYTIPPDSPRAVKAAAFGRELVAACRARDVPLNELGRATGVGHSSLDKYRRGLILPKVEVAHALAAALRWPRLATMIEEARTFTCARSGCSRTFRNDTGAPRKYCSATCVALKNKLAAAARDNRAAGREGSWSSSQASAVRRLRQGLRLADERNVLLGGAIDAMCRGCEPEGVCRIAECPLRPFSPLPLAAHEGTGEPRASGAIRRASWTPQRREAFTDALHRRWAQPGARERASEIMRRGWAQHPERADQTRAGVARRPRESFSQASKKAWATRRKKAAA